MTDIPQENTSCKGKTYGPGNNHQLYLKNKVFNISIIFTCKHPHIIIFTFIIIHEMALFLSSHSPESITVKRKIFVLFRESS